MANNNLPAHDFAPPWLKIPSYDCHKPVGDYPSHHTSRRDEHCLIRRDREDDFSPRYFFDSKWDRDSHSGDRKGSFFPSRHSSIDIEDGSFFQPGGHLSKSQPSLLRRPSSRHDFRGDHTNPYNKGGPFTEVNSNGSAYGVPNKGSKGPLAGHSEAVPRTNGFSEGNNGIDVTSNNFNQEFPSLKGCEEDADQTTSGLNGSVWENPLNAKVHGISHKMQVFQRPLKESVKETRSRSPFGGPVSCISPKLSSVNLISSTNNKSNNTLNQPAAAIYRALIPAKSTHSKKMGKDVSRPSTKRQTPPLPTSSLVGPPTTQNMEILVKNPRMRGCNKSHFLKTLRGEGDTPATQMQQATENTNTSSSNEPDCHQGENTSSKPLKSESLTNGNTLLGEEEEEEDEEEGNEILDSTNHLQSVENHNQHFCENGIEIASPEGQDDHHLLSSSLEAEQRLLKEMGWKEDGSDDDAYAPLTEDELKEFRDLALKMAEKKNGLHMPQPGPNASSLQGLHQPKLNWSPKRGPPFTPLILPPNEEEGSWSSTSDSD